MKKLIIIVIGIAVIISVIFILQIFFSGSEEAILPSQNILDRIEGAIREKLSTQRIIFTPTSIPILQPTKPPTPVNGKCGSSLNSCMTGIFQDITDTSISYLWNCLGSNGGATVSCNLAKSPATLSNILDRIEAAIKAKLKR